MTTSQKQFIELLKAGLWGTQVQESLFKDNVNWQSIIQIAREQTVLGIICDSIETLPKEMWPPKDILHKLMSHNIRNIQMHTLLNSTLNKITKALDSAGIPSVLLKGQGVAQNYRRPECRSCGDIDLYVGEANFLDAYNQLKLLNDVSIEIGHECTHHMQMTINGVEIELHKQADYMPGVKTNQDLQDWTTECIDNNFGTSSLPQWNNNGNKICLPSTTYNAFFILHHAVRHMTVGGIGFRQLCDWTMFLYQQHKEISIDLLQEKLEKYNMTKVWMEFGILAVNTLGLPTSCLPLSPTSYDSPKTEQILKQIFISGNFGHADAKRNVTKQTSYIKKKWRDFKYQSSRLFMLFQIFPIYSISYFKNWIIEGIQRLFTRK